MRFIKRSSILLVALLALLAMFGSYQTAVFAQDATPEAVAFDIQPVLADYLATLPSDFYGIKPDMALVELSKDTKPFLIDVRSETEIGDGGYIAGAVLIPLRSLTESLDMLPAQDQPIIVYCGIGHRGAMATEVLQLLGYTNVRSIFGGFSGWKAASLPVATGVPAEAVVSKAPAPSFDPALFTVLNEYVTTLPDGFSAVSPTNALRNLSSEPKPFLLDVRANQELITNGYIDGQVNIPLNDLLDNLDKLPADKSQPIITYCAIGHRGAMAMTTLQLLGYTNVSSISGGFGGWVKANLPIVQPSS